MHLKLPVNFNYGDTKEGWTEDDLKTLLNIRTKGEVQKILKNCFDSFEEVFLSDPRFSNLNVITLRQSSVLDKDVDSFVIKFYKREYEGICKYYIETGQYAGFICYKGLNIYISLSEKYNVSVLNHLLSYANNINIDSLPLPTSFQKTNSELDYLLCFLFIQKLEKASILGLPKQFVNRRERLNTIKGKIDFTNYIKTDLPFKGSISVNYRDRQEVQEIIDVIYYTLYLIKEKFSSHALFKVRSIFNELQARYSKVKPQSDTIFNAQNHSVLNNPMFQQFKAVLDLAELIIKNLSPDHNDNSYNQITGNLYNTSELFELYIERLLKNNLSEWVIEPQNEIQIYSNQFFKRKLKPDFVLHNYLLNKYIVLDAKFKTMNYSYYDVDREDIFQLHTYSYYFHHNLLFSGLVYPLQFTKDKIISTNILDSFDNHFGIFGVELNSSSTYESIKLSEEKLINQLNTLITINN